MPNLSIKDVPETWADALRQRAARNHRSLQGELMAIVQQAIEHEVPTLAKESAKQGAPCVVGFDKRGWPIVQQGWKTIEQVMAELKVKYPEPILSQPLGVDIVREDRDSR